MEIHAHPHTERKKWTHYLWEFLMLFLAVFCGFLAENFREHQVEHKREKVLMKSMMKDLQTDITNFSGMVRGITNMNSHIDTIVLLLSNFSELNKNAGEIYQQEVWINLYYKFIYTDRTIEQLKNSGNFRLIRNTSVSDAIIDYDGYVRNYVIDMQNEYVLEKSKKVGDFGTGIFKSSVFKNWMKGGFKNNTIQLPAEPYFLITDTKQLDTYINLLNKYSVSNYWFIQNTQLAIKKAQTLDSLIKKEYRIN